MQLSDFLARWHETSPVVQGALIAACVSVIGVFISTFINVRIQSRALSHARASSEAERIFEYRRDVYADAAIWSQELINSFMGFYNLDDPWLPKIDAAMARAATGASTIEIVGSARTVNASMNLIGVSDLSFLGLRDTRRELDSRQTEMEKLASEAKGLGIETPAGHLLAEKVRGLLEIQKAKIVDFDTRVFAETDKLVRASAELVVSMRADLGIVIDEGEYLGIIERAQQSSRLRMSSARRFGN